MMKYQVPKEHYFRMYNKVFDLELKSTTFLLYSYLVCCAGNKGSCWPSLETISRKTGLSISTIQEHLKILEQRVLAYAVTTIHLLKPRPLHCHVVPKAPAAKAALVTFKLAVR